MITMVLATAIASELTRPEPFRPPNRESSDFGLTGNAQMAAETYEREGQSALARYLEQVERTSRMRAFLFGPQLVELSGRLPPKGARELAQKVMQTSGPETAELGFPPLLARAVRTPRGDLYVLVAELPRRTPPPWYSHLLHVLGILLIGGAFCYWLAKYLTAPVAKLRIATHELARGNLAARVGPSKGNRRDELVSLGSDFDLMAEQIESLVEAQRRLLGDISHELRSPLARLNVALELARQRAGTNATSALERIQHEAENLNEMIGQLLTLTRMETGAQEITKTQLDLAALVREIADDADFEARSRNRSVKLRTIQGCMIVGSEQLLRRAIENVVRNAVQYTTEGTEVEITLSTNGDHEGQIRLARISVRDHGVGVPESALADIFRPFYRVDEARDRHAGGVGLGLAIAERAIRLHEGTATANNAEDGGLIVTVTLPIRGR